MNASPLCIIRNCDTVPLSRIPVLSMQDFRSAVIDATAAGARLSALFGKPSEHQGLCLFAVIAQDELSTLALLSTEVDHSYPSLTPDCPQAHWFEREIAEQWSVTPAGHPWLKPIRFHAPYRTDRSSRPEEPAIGLTEFFQVSGTEIHEVAVGPVHAGVIEPGHFRFQCHGENVYHLEISLGYQHRGIEQGLIKQPAKRRIHLIESIAGDTTIGHTTAYCHAVESLASKRAPARPAFLRGIALELERIANHVGDLGALAGDVGYLPSMSYCGRIRGDFLNMTALLCGNRFGRGLVRPGGISVDVEASRIQELSTRLEKASVDLTGAVELMFESPSVLARFEGTGEISQQTCREIGLVGPMARACGEHLDVRHDFPISIFRFAQIPVSTWHTGDVFSRALVRWLEVQRSLQFIRDQLAAIPEGVSRVEAGALAPAAMVVSLVEGWRGEICHVATTDDAGNLAHYKVVDPSFHNWFGLALALRNQQISDFPLCNKSANLSYCGHDL